MVMPCKIIPSILNRVHVEVEVGKMILKRYMRGIEEGRPATWSLDDKNVIVMSLTGTNDHVSYV